MLYEYFDLILYIFINIQKIFLFAVKKLNFTMLSYKIYSIALEIALVFSFIFALFGVWRVIYLRNVRISRANPLWKYWPVIKVSHTVYWITSTINQRTVSSLTLNFISDVSRVTTTFTWRQRQTLSEHPGGFAESWICRSMDSTSNFIVINYRVGDRPLTASVCTRCTAVIEQG